MPLSVKVGGVWKDGTSLHAKVGGAWKNVTSGWVRVAGAWKQFYAALSAVLDATEYAASAASSGGPASATVTVSALVTGTGPFTYSWTVTGVYSTLLNATTANLGIRLTATSELRTGTVKCTVTDTFGNSVETNVSTWSLEISPL